MAAHQEEVARLDVQVLQAVLEVHHVERLGRLAQVADQLAARYPRLAGLLPVHQDVVQALVGQLHDDDEFVVDALDAVHRQDERVADGLDEVEGPQLLLGAAAVAVQAVVVGAGNELDRLEEAAGRLAPALAERFDQAVAGDWLQVGGFNCGHSYVLAGRCRCSPARASAGGITAERNSILGHKRAPGRCGARGYGETGIPR